MRGTLRQVLFMATCLSLGASLGLLSGSLRLAKEQKQQVMSFAQSKPPHPPDLRALGGSQSSSAPSEAASPLQEGTQRAIDSPDPSHDSSEELRPNKPRGITPPWREHAIPELRKRPGKKSKRFSA